MSITQVAAPSRQQVLFDTGSISGLHPHRLLGSGYLSASNTKAQILCGNEEGWGPMSPFRYDFTPCFIDVWVAIVAAFGILAGGLALWLLRRQEPRYAFSSTLHYRFKQSLLLLIIADVAVQLAFQIASYGSLWACDFRSYTTFLTIASLAVVFAIQHAEHFRLRHANGVVLFYWLLLLIALSVKLRSLISQKLYITNEGYFITYCAGYGLSWVEFLIEWLWPRKLRDYEILGEEDGDECPVEYATVFSKLTFSWITPFMRYGYQVFLTEGDLWGLAKADRSDRTSKLFEESWKMETSKKHGHPSLWKALFRAYGGPYMMAAIFKVGNDFAAFAQPQLLRLLIGWVDSHSAENVPQPVIMGVAVALAMFTTAIFQTAMIHQYFQLTFVTGMRVNSGLASAIYKKSLKLSNEGRANKTTGDIVNFMAVDSKRLQDLTQFAQQLWSAPLQITICMVSLYQLVGWSMLAGVGVMIFMIPVNGFIARIMKTLQKKQMKNKDARSRLIAEIVNNMKSIKLYAWGSAFMNKLNFIRNDQELKTLRRIGASQAFANFTWSSTPFLVSCSTFAVFVLVNDEPLTTKIAFPALTLFNLLTFPLAVLPMVITSIIEATVAVGRLTDFLTAEEVQPDAVELLDAAEELHEDAVIINDGTFCWDRHEKRSVLKNIHFTASKGELTCIVGRVGSGKSSLLQSIMGDLWKERGRVRLHGTVAYVAQQPWIMNATVKENITFGYKYDSEFYEQTVHSCALLDDFAQLPDGDETVVGERGISLSGGQKARVALARAVYARADVYILDDVLSAVDSHVGKHITKRVLGSKGLLRTKTRILATNSVPVLKEAANLIYLLKDSEIAEKGTYDQLIAMKGSVSELIKTAIKEKNDSPSSSSSSGAVTPIGTDSETSTFIECDGSADKNDIEEAQERDDCGTYLMGIQPGGSKRRPSMATVRRASAASFRGPMGKLGDEEGPRSKTATAKEHMERGKVKWDVYTEYAKTSNLFAVAFYLTTLIVAQTAQVCGSIWLKDWSEKNTKLGRNPDVGRYIGIYLAFGLGAAALTVCQTLILWIFCSIEASRKLHEKMATAIFRSPMSFYDVTPAGRILNRFSSDIYRVDEILARTFNMLFVNLTRSGFTLVIISVSTPIFVSLIVPLGLTYYWLQRYYLRTSRELKRLDSVSRSPIYAHFQESLGGTSTIRAYRQKRRFEMENQWRVDANLRAYFPSVSANRWLAVRLEFIGAVVILGAAGLSVWSVARGSGLTSGWVGLTLSYGLQITTSLNWIVRQTVEVETNIVSVERVLEYARLPSEAPDIIPQRRVPAAWPTKGAVEFHSFSTRYREGLDPVLKNINLEIRSHEKIGVVGRTGAGKSSLTLSLFRIIEADTGNIIIDGIDTSKIGLLDLRRRLAIIPQDAALFEGTIRDNLDPGHIYEEAELWSVLEHARLKDHILNNMDGGLNAKINEGGSNLSQGQRQLVSLARAMLAPSNILVLDEATAAVDVETDALIQKTLRSNLFSDKTIITVAHRINTIMDSDRVVVLEKGEIVEHGPPQELIERKGMFYSLAKQAGLEE